MGKGGGLQIKQLLNGAPIPNWLKLIVWTTLFGFQIGTCNTKKDIQNDMKLYAFQDSTRTADISETLNRRTKQINAELKNISKVTRYIAREVE